MAVDARKGAIAGGIVLAGVLLVVILYVMRKALGGFEDAAKNVGDTAEAATAGVEAGTRIVFSPLTNADSGLEVKQSEFVAGQKQLKLEIIGKPKQKNNFWEKHNDYTLLVTSDGVPVPGAEISSSAVIFEFRLYYGTKKHYTGPDGRLHLRWSAQQRLGTHADDDLEVVARKPGFNPSNRLVLR